MVLEELLAPAGSYEVLVTAVNAGADAVYIAGQNYGARAYAKNFTIEEIEKAVNYAHLNGACVHVTVNTLINNFEIVDVLNYLFKLYQIGVDAGGTHSTAIAYDENGKELGRAEGGPGQINADYEGGIKNISDTINELLNKIDGDCMRVLVGIAGLSVVGNAPEVAATISSRINNLPTRAITDSLLALYAGLEGDDGALVIAGTGSVYNGLQDGHLIAVGGYGNILGDEGSGYAIARSAMQSALLSWDKREHNSLIDMFTKLFNVEHMDECNAKFYKMSNPEVAGMAVHVAKLADKGDEDATKIIKEQAHLLARDIIIGLDRYEDPKPMKIALTGSVLANNDMLRGLLEDEVKSKYPDVIFSISNDENARAVLFDKSKDYRYFTNHEDR